ncbi:hypothetical protein ACIQF6_34070 [Kitasatospora sp. NPDC092948]|uniref:hypothetical protein n=1 Tax=Kitasatospora sp. NPDC092948 TaxID=3364088 RepID=UPI003821D83D
MGEWIVAMACAMIAAIAYEAAVKVLKETRQVTLMLPALLLRLTRLTTSRAKYRLLYERQWYPDLYDLLTDTHHAAFARYVKGLRFSLALVLGGAIRAARQTQTPVRRTHRRSDRPVRMLVSGTVAGYTGAKLAGDSSSYILKALAAMASLGAIGITVAIWRFHRRRPQRRKQRP